MHRDWTYAKNSDIEVRIDLVRSETNVEYRFIGEQTWTASPFQSINFCWRPLKTGGWSYNGQE